MVTEWLLTVKRLLASIYTCQVAARDVVAQLLLAAGALYGQVEADPCPRPHIGSVVSSPADLYSATDIYGRRRYCYIAGDGSEAPTLRVQPGDELVLKLKNEAPAGQAGHEMEVHGPCGKGRITASTTNLHFHGLSVPPVCHQDEVLSTLVQPAESGFEYRVKIPDGQPPGLYWYHPHPHGYAEAQVLGGASGALIVEGIERVKPEVAGLPERVLVLRDQGIPGASAEAGEGGRREPSKDVSINFVAVLFPADRPAAMVGKPNRREFWRVLNAAADTYFDLQIRTGPSLREARTPLPLELVAMDGVPVSKDPIAARTDVLLAPGARAEWVVTTPAEGVFAQVVTLGYDTGPNGESTPARVLANFFSSHEAREAAAQAPIAPAAKGQAVPAMADAAPVRERKLYFSEERREAGDPKSPMMYFLTVEGKAPRLFDMNFKEPDVIARQGTVEDWVIENRAAEAHAFHIHQIHFQLLERDGRPVKEPLWRDTVDLPYWDGKSSRYPSVKLRMDFRDRNILGTFLYHCHILEHEDGGMMGSIRVEP
jgi:FtsP/CotA-like multicopper oxidase with cupredoxin domain